MQKGFAFSSRDFEKELRKIVRQQLSLAVYTLEHLKQEKSAVHTARVAIKKLRAAFQLFKPVNTAQFKKTDDQFKFASRLLSGSRDNQVLIETLEGLCESSEMVKNDPEVQQLRKELENEKLGLDKALLRKATKARRLLRKLMNNSDAIEVSKLKAVDVAKGVKLPLRQCKKYWERKAGAHSELQMHALRKAVKCHLYQMQLLSGLNPSLERRIKQLDRLSQVLGRYQDLSVLKNRSRASGTEIAVLEELILNQQLTLLEKAHQLSGPLFFGPNPLKGMNKLLRKTSS